MNWHLLPLCKINLEASNQMEWYFSSKIRGLENNKAAKVLRFIENTIKHCMEWYKKRKEK